MDVADYLGKYAEGWRAGDVDTIVSALANDYVLDDPNAGKITKAGYVDYMGELKEIVTSARGFTSSGPFMKISEVITQEQDGVLTGWCWWEIPGTSIKGSGLIKANASGVISERLAYFTKLPN